MPERTRLVLHHKPGDEIEIGGGRVKIVRLRNGRITMEYLFPRETKINIGKQDGLDHGSGEEIATLDTGGTPR